MDKPQMSIEEFLNKFPPGTKRESILSRHKKEIFMLKKKGYRIAQIVTYFELVVGQKVSRSSVIRFTSKKTKSDPKPDPPTNQEATKADPKGDPRPDKQQSGNDPLHAPPPAPPGNLSQTSRKQKRENFAAQFDT